MLDYRKCKPNSGESPIFTGDPADGTISGGFSFREMFFGEKSATLLPFHNIDRLGPVLAAVRCYEIRGFPQFKTRLRFQIEEKKWESNVTQLNFKTCFPEKQKKRLPPPKKNLPIFKKTMCIFFFGFKSYLRKWRFGESPGFSKTI